MRPHMTPKLLLALILLLLTPSVSIAQDMVNSLQRNPEGREELLYKITKQQAKYLLDSTITFSDTSFFTSFVKEIKNKEEVFRMQPGHYLSVRASGPQLRYQYIPVSPFLIYLLDNSTDFLLQVKDKKQHTNKEQLTIVLDGHTIAFDKAANAYRLPKSNYKGLLEVNDGTEQYYFRIDKSHPSLSSPKISKGSIALKPYRAFIKAGYYVAALPVDGFKSITKGYPQGVIYNTKNTIRNWIERREDRRYNRKNDRRYPDYRNNREAWSFFSKPKYRPNDTVSFKMLLMNAKTKKWEHTPLTARVRMQNETYYLGTCTPANGSGYYYSFQLNDSMKFKLDQHYGIELINADSVVYYTGYFSIEEYELQKSVFKIECTTREQIKNKPFEIKYTAKDENGLPMRDTKAEVIITAQSISNIQPDQLFVPYEVWKHEFAIEDGTKTFLIPDSLFARTDLYYYIKTTLSNAENERKEESFSVNYRQQKFEIKDELINDTLILTAYQNDSMVYEKATIKALDRYGYFLSEEEVTLPYSATVNTHAQQYLLTSPRLSRSINMDNHSARLGCNAFRTGDSVFVQIDNPRNLDFTYQLYGRNKELARGYGTMLDTKFAANEKDLYYVAIQYIWAGRTKSDMYQIPLHNKRVNLKVEQPQVIYPGKESEITITATDYRDRPIKDMSILSFAYTAKFPENGMPTLPDLSKTQRQKQLVNNFSEGSGFSDPKAVNLNYPYWKKHIVLDTMPAYRFIFPSRVIEKIEVPMEDSITQFAPFVTDQGRLQGVQYVLVNRVPVYFGFTDHKTPYSFETDTTGYKQVVIRTQNKMIVIDSLQFKPYHKTIFSIDLQNKMEQVTVQERPDTLTAQEISDYSNYIIQLNEIYTSSAHRFLSTWDKKGIFRIQNNGYNSNYRYYDDNNNNAVRNTLGPVVNRYWKYNIPGEYAIDVELERLFTYTFKPQLVKMVNIAANNPVIYSKTKSTVPSLNDRVITKEKMMEWYNEKPKQARRTLSYMNGNDGNARLEIELAQLATDTNGYAIQPLNMILTQPGNFNFISIGSGNTRQFSGLKAGNYELLIIEEDHIYRKVAGIKVQDNGINFLRIKHTDTLRTAQVRLLDSFIHSYYTTANYNDPSNQIMGQYIEAVFNGPKEIIEGQVLDENGESVIGASIRIKDTKIGTLTDIDGKFSLGLPLELKKNAKLVISALGLGVEEFPLSHKSIYKFSTLNNNLEEIVITTPYGPPTTKEKYVGAADVISSKEILNSPVSDINRAIEGAAPGVQVTNGSGQPGSGASIHIRGRGSLSASETPLLVIDGVPYAGDLSSIDPTLVGSMSVLKDAMATSLYGARGANGVLLITMKSGAKLPDNIKQALEETPPIIPEDIMVSGLRNSFSDDAFWQPNLVTDDKGKVSFKVKFPDDLTSWKTFVYATDEHMRVGQTTGNIKSFKPVSAALQTTRFLVQGDSANFIGKSVNYISDTLAVTNTYFINDTLYRTTAATLVKYNNEQLSITAPRQDSVKLKYLLTKTDGYFDGEEKSIEIMPRGVSVAKGAFMALDSKDTTIHIPAVNNEEPLYLNATASLIDIVIDEIQKVKNYRHLCNEQLSSKIIATLNQQRIYDILKKPLDKTHKTEVQKMINLLQQRQNSSQLWGWWGDGESVIWISQHVIKALVMAKEMNYNVSNISFEKIVQPIVYQWERDTTMSDLQSLKLLQIAGMKLDYEKYLKRLERNKRASLGQQLDMILLRQQLKLPYSTKVLNTCKQEDIFGNIFWKDTTQHIYENEVLSTLKAFKIIQADSSIKLNKHKVINWLIQQRKVSGWRNIYESSQIIEAIASSIDFTDTLAMKPVLVFSGGLSQKVTTFPFEQKITNKQSVSVNKTGAAPVYFTWYQRHWDTANSDLGKDFVLTSSFEQNGKAITTLNNGEAVQLKVKVTVPKEAEFVMIDIPIPAGCSYQSKDRNYYGNEVHREHYKDRVSIFCQRLPKGEYTYTVHLLPRFTGQYTLNPAKAELMYFPVFYGREKIREVSIK